MTDTFLGPIPAREDRHHAETLSTLYRILDALRDLASLASSDPSFTPDDFAAALTPRLPLSPSPLPLPDFPTAREIATAIADTLPSNQALAKSLDDVAARLEGMGKRITAGLLSPSGSSLAHERAILDIKNHVTDYETRLDYGARTDSNPVYAGRAEQNVSPSAAQWSIQRLEYDASSRLTRVQVLTGAWENRASLLWSN